MSSATWAMASTTPRPFTRHPFFRSRPSRLLLVTTLAVAGLALALSYLPFSPVFGFLPLPVPRLFAMIGLTALYVLVTEVAKKESYARMGTAADPAESAVRSGFGGEEAKGNGG